MILLIGATGYIGAAFADELCRRNEQFITISRRQVDYTRFDVLLNFLREYEPTFVINAAGYTGKPNVDACELDKAGTLLGNILLPQTISNACSIAGIPLGHVSSGCIYSGAKIIDGDTVRVEKDMMTHELVNLVKYTPEKVIGFNETDIPNFSFRDGPCSFYSGTKALGEELLMNVGHTYIWRLRIPFDEFNNKRNYLSKIQSYSKIYDNVNSISHRGDFVKACLDTWKLRSPFGIYNVTNPGFVTTRYVVEQIQKILAPSTKFQFWTNDEEFYNQAAKTPRSNCVMDVTKLLSVGVKIRSVNEALEDSLRNWKL